MLTFVVFSVRARNGSDGGTLDTARVFTALSLFALLSEPLASLVMSLATFMGGVGSFVRIQQFLNSDEHPDTRRKSIEIDEAQKSAASNVITVNEADFGWDPANQPPLLKGINLAIPLRQLTMIVGPVGCGKSTLLLALLGEIPALAGSVSISSTSIAYSSQAPWHMNGTVREAIVGSEPLDEKWYARVVRACALRQDFQDLPMGDSSRIGSGGIALSGGQSKRIVRPLPVMSHLLSSTLPWCVCTDALLQALARAVYVRREIVILDDVLSGLDTSTENHVFHNLFGDNGIFREMHTTVVLVSSSGEFPASLNDI